MKKIFIYIASAVAALSLVSCDKIFDSLEGDLTKMSAADLTATEAGLDRLMSTLYQSLPMGAFGELDKNTIIAQDSANGASYSGSISGAWSYTYVRDINFFIESIAEALEKGVISQSTYDIYLGEAKFIRAYYYFASVRMYGGVPIVTETLDKYYGTDQQDEKLYVKRSTEKETWDFVLSELDDAIALLPETRSSGKYRATKWAALGLKSRAALWAASVSRYWNQAAISSTDHPAVAQKLAYMEESYAANYYQQSIAASEAIINSGKFQLYGAQPATVDAAVKNLQDLFLDRKDEEFIFGRSYKNGVATNSNGIDLKNSPNQAHGSGTGVWRFGCYGVTLDLVDMYDNYGPGFTATDGTIATRTDGVENEYIATPSQAVGINAIKSHTYVKYDSPADAFKDKDARFQAWVIYPSCNFRNTEIIIQGGMWKSNGDLVVYDDSNPKETVGGKDYYGYGAINETFYSGFYYRGHTNDGSWYTTGFGLKKFLDPTNKVSESQNPWYDIRYTEILLNYCEAQVELGGTNAGNSKQYLNAIRRRANFRDEKDATLDNVLKERTVELAFEDDFGATQYRRRAFFNRDRDLASNPTGGRKHALIPIVDLHDGTPHYIFVRANHYRCDTDTQPNTSNFSALSYYGNISNYTVNDLVRNPAQD